jgi:uncharacterized Zn finger protein
MAYYDRWTTWAPYVRMTDRRQNAARHLTLLGTQGRTARPVVPRGRGRAIATTFWGRAWCDNLHAYAALSNRLERGRRYLRGGLVVDLAIERGTVKALVSGTDVYEIRLGIKPMPSARWRAVVKACSGKIDSVVELLAGRFDESVMRNVCRQGTGLFPAPAEMTFRCTCPDGARGGWMCKHVAATLYGVGVRLDEEPALLFRLRQVDHAELIARATAGLVGPAVSRRAGRAAIAPDRLSAVFGIDLETPPAAPRGRSRPTPAPGDSMRRPADPRRGRGGS